MAFDDVFFMCEPRYFGVEYVINPWMAGNVGRVDRALAARQWRRLHDALAARARVETIAPQQGLPDMTFTANAGLVHGDMFVPARFRYRQRRPETRHFIEWFRERHYRVVALAGESAFEGEGDALPHPGEPLLWGGYGVRSALIAYRGLIEAFEVEVAPLRLVDERFYHLDTCFCPLPEGRAIYYPGAFDHESLALIRARIPAGDRFEVGPGDALNFACNAIVVGRAFITNHASDALCERLRAWGYETIVCPLGEFIRAGGAAKCLALRLKHAATAGRVQTVPAARGANGVCDRLVEIEGHLLDQGLANRLIDRIADGGCDFEIEEFRAAQRHDQHSAARVRVVAPSAARLERVLARLIELGARVADEQQEARLERVERDGVAPDDFYSTTIYPTDVRVAGQWLRAADQRMDAAIVIGDSSGAPAVRCVLLRDLARGQRVVCGVEGIRIHARHEARTEESFGFMTAAVSSERRVELAIDDVAWEMRRIRAQGGRIVVVAGPVVIHTGGGPHLARLIRLGYVQALLGGNAIAVHDIEQALYGTSLGVNLRHGTRAQGGHQHHLRAINTIRACGSIAEAVRRGVLREGVMYECVVNHVPFALAGSIRDDGPLPETRMDLIAAQAEYAALLKGAQLVLMLSSMLHSIGVGNMTPAGVRLICVDINPAVSAKLADRGSVESTGLVTDVGLFLNLLASRLDDALDDAEAAKESALAHATDSSG